MPTTTPIAKSKTAALSRILDSVPKGYHRYTFGTVKASKAEALANKFHNLYGIGCTPAQRLTRKIKGRANVILVMYWPNDAEQVDWLLLATDGAGMEEERLRFVEAKPRLSWLGYELVRYSNHGRTSWSWRRPKHEMQEHFALLKNSLVQHHHSAVSDHLKRIANQPGFHGVREQSWALYEYAKQNGFSGELPHLFYLQKVSHGERLNLHL